LQNSEKHRIVIIANTTWNIYNFRRNILKILLKNDFEVFVLAPVDKYIFYKEEFPDITHIPLKTLGRDSINPIRELRFLIELIRIYKRIKPDMIIHYTVKPNIYGGFAAGLLKIPSIAVVTGLGFAFLHNGFIKSITRILYRLSSKYHKKMVFENHEDRELFIRDKIVREEKSTSIKGCGVNIRYYTPGKNKRKREKIIFTFLGRLLYDKGVVEFVEAAKIIKERYENAEFWIVGEIDQKNPAMLQEEDLIEWVRNRTVIYHGFKDNVKKYIAASDCIVLPTYREGNPRALTEAMAMGKVVIATDTAGCKEAVDHEKTGLLVPLKQVTPLADAMEKIINMPEAERLEMGKQGRIKAIEIFDERLIARDILFIVKEILSENKER
jgi:glycosyltransferase involved in cell wall biosynthesis